MKKSLTIAVLAALTGLSQAAIITLLDEEFTGGAAPADTATATWTTTAGNGFETFDGSGGASIRGMGQTYGGALGVPTSTALPGGLQVLGNITDATVTISVTLPGDLDDTVNGVLSFWAGQRIGGDSSGGFEHDLEVINVTDSRTIRALGDITGFANYTWNANSESLGFIAADAGDTIEIRFYERGGSTDRGLVLADLQFDVTTVPEPSSTALLGLGGLSLIWRRRK